MFYSRGKSNIEKELKISNYSFLFGCRPGKGVQAMTQFANNFIQLCMSYYDNDFGFLDIPKIFSMIKSSDAQFESVRSDLA